MDEALKCIQRAMSWHCDSACKHRVVRPGGKVDYMRKVVFQARVALRVTWEFLKKISAQVLLAGFLFLESLEVTTVL